MKFLTLGDPLGITVELVQKVLKGPHSPFCLIGSRFHWEDQMRRLQAEIPSKICWSRDPLEDVGLFFRSGGLSHGADILGVDVSTPRYVLAEELSARERGQVSWNALWKLKELLEPFRADWNKVSIVTGPVDKYAMNLVFPFQGQTEFFEGLQGRSGVMVLAGEKLKVALCTNHVPLKEVSSLISKERVFSKLALFYDCLQKWFGKQEPRIGVCGLNPHASDQGLFGDEERFYIEPAVQSFGRKVKGPLSADTVFYEHMSGQYDGVLAMYHDQGLGPLKTLHFDSAVNVTGGLDFLRVSPDHGPAKNLFLKNQAQSLSFQRAFELAGIL